MQGVDSFQTLPGDPGVMFALRGAGVRCESGTETDGGGSPRRTPCVRYFAGDADGAVLELLKDASGKSSFAGASKSASVEGVVRFLGEGRVAALRAVSADKGGVPGVVIFLK